MTQLAIVEGLEQFVGLAEPTDRIGTRPSLPRSAPSLPLVDAPAGSPMATPATRASASDTARRLEGPRLADERRSAMAFEPVDRIPPRISLVPFSLYRHRAVGGGYSACGQRPFASSALDTKL